MSRNVSGLFIKRNTDVGFNAFVSTPPFLKCVTWEMGHVFVHGGYVWNQMGSWAVLRTVLRTTRMEKLLQCSIAARCWNPGLFPYLTLYGSAACAGTEEFHAAMGGSVDHFHTCLTDTSHSCCCSAMNYLPLFITLSLAHGCSLAGPCSHCRIW